MEKKQNSEGWVKFARRHFADGGTIDRWVGDCINDPNRPTQSNLQLNTFATYYRLNGGTWINDRDLFKMGVHWSMTDLPAAMIWENCYDDYQAILNEEKKQNS
jgi:hypothetical protein